MQRGTAFERLLQRLHVERGDQISSPLQQGISGTQQAAMTRYRRNIRREVQKDRWHDALSAHERVRIRVYLLTAAGLMAGAESEREKEEWPWKASGAVVVHVVVWHEDRPDRIASSARADATSSLEDISDTDA